MSFDELRYFAFLPVVYALYRVLSHANQNRMLLVASYLFYGCWDPRFLLLIIATTAMDFCAGLVIDRGRVEARRAAEMLGLCAASAVLSVAVDWRALFTGQAGGGLPLTADNLPLLYLMAGAAVAGYLIYLALLRLAPEARRRAAIIVSVTGNLALLGFFKYFNFFVDSAESFLLALGVADPESWRLGIVLPVGISFYTFQTMSYTLDIYRRKLPATDKALDFALFVAYFPPLVAGPIERASHLLPQLAQRRFPTWEQSMQGLWLILFGLFKKIAIADGVAVSVNSVYGSVSATWLDVVGATVLFAIQIYCDFSGYSDIARGTSKLFGVELVRNFRTPYFSSNPSEFWRRWHISLSTWLRDYLYISLGGNRGAPSKTYRNLMLTMLLGGLWHGAAWNFIFWGLFHGALLCIHRLIAGEGEHRAASVAGRVARIAGFFAITCYGWLLFRAASLEQVVEFTRVLVMDFGNFSTTMAAPAFAALLGIPLLLLIDFLDYRIGLKPLRLRLSPVLRGGAGAALLFILFMGTSNAPQQFIYFQF